MSKKKQSKSKKSNKNIEQSILSIFKNSPRKIYNYKQIAKRLNVNSPAQKQIVLKALLVLHHKEMLIEVTPGKYKIKQELIQVTGTLQLKRRGGWVISETVEEDIYIPSQFLNNALEGDIVRISVNINADKNRKPEGEIIEIIERAKKNYIGTVQILNSTIFVKIDNDNMPFDFYIQSSKLNGAKNNDKVIVRFDKWPDDAKNPYGKIIEILGKQGEHNTEIHAIMAEYDLPWVFPKKVLDAAEKIEQPNNNDYKSREDFKNITTFTIDPEDAKDFDDALSVKTIKENVWEIGVHIADVTHYIKPGSVLDNEAQNRATSIYLVDRVVPMLPEKLSNDICSLKPNTDKLCFSVIFELNQKGEILKHRFAKTVIQSNRRFTYQEAQDRITTGEGDLAKELQLLNNIAVLLRDKRMGNGAIAFDREEVRIKLDDDNKPVGMYIKKSLEANKLIEEFMLLANKYVGYYLQKRNGNYGIYRIHDYPDMEKLFELSTFLRKIDYTVNFSTPNKAAFAINKLLKEIKGKSEESIVNTLAIKSMAKAKYSSENIGHFGLAFEAYTHFTSPIRRYPDMIAHRLLYNYLNKKRISTQDTVENLCQHSSNMEQKAAKAERDSIKYKQIEYLENFIGKNFDGIVADVTEYGIFVELIETKCEGLIRISDMNDDYYDFDKSKYALIGRKKGRVIQLGNKVLVKIKSANLAKKQLDLELAIHYDQF